MLVTVIYNAAQHTIGSVKQIDRVFTVWDHEALKPKTLQELGLGLWACPRHLYQGFLTDRGDCFLEFILLNAIHLPLGFNLKLLEFLEVLYFLLMVLSHEINIGLFFN